MNAFIAIAMQDAPLPPDAGVLTGTSAAVIAIVSACTVALGTLVSKYFASRKELVEAETLKLNSEHARQLALCEERLRLKEELIQDLRQQLAVYQRGNQAK